MAFAITQLVWGALEFSEGYETAGQMSSLFKTVKWGTDYFVKCHASEFEYYGMVSTFITERLCYKCYGMNSVFSFSLRWEILILITSNGKVPSR